MSTDVCNLTVVIPAYNEGHRIQQALLKNAQYLAALPLSWEMVVVDDGSTDETKAQVKIAERKLAPEPIRFIEHPRNQGKGAAVRTGVLAAHGQYVLFCDADGATPIDELSKFLPELQKGTDVVVGSRRIDGSQIQRHQNSIRQFCGAMYTKITNFLVAPGIADITCGFKALQRQAAKQIFSKMTLNGWSFDAELFFLARYFKLKVVQVPISWSDQPNTKVRVFKDAITSFCELLLIRFRALKGDYR